jgi:hypothetical protein
MRPRVNHAVLGLMLAASLALAQTEGKKPKSWDFGQLSVSGYVHVQWQSDYRPAVYPRHSFELRRVRLRFSYIPSDIGASVELGGDDLQPSIEDAYIQYRINQAFGFVSGLRKMPFSREELTSASKLMMIERGLSNDRFGDRGFLGRDIGLAVEGELPDMHLGYSAGVFNGNRARLSRDYNNAKQFVERMTFAPVDWLTLGISGTQRNDSVTGELVHAYGLDFSCPLKRMRFEGEVLAGNAEPGDWMLGAWLAGAYRMGAFEPAVKLERLFPDLTAHAAAETEVAVGCNWYPHRRVELKADLVADTDAWPGPAVLAQAQMSF